MKNGVIPLHLAANVAEEILHQMDYLLRNDIPKKYFVVGYDPLSLTPPPSMYISYLTQIDLDNIAAGKTTETKKQRDNAFLADNQADFWFWYVRVPVMWHGNLGPEQRLSCPLAYVREFLEAQALSQDKKREWAIAVGKTIEDRRYMRKPVR